MATPRNNSKPKEFNTRIRRTTETVPTEELKPVVSAPSICCGIEVPNDTIRRIRAALISGEHPQLATIARINHVTRDFIVRMLDNDPELKSVYETNTAYTGEQIEQAAVEMCLDGAQHPIARQKMMEFMLTHMIPDKYGENADTLSSMKGVKRITLVKQMAVIDVDENGIPKTKEPEIIDVKAE